MKKNQIAKIDKVDIPLIKFANTDVLIDNEQKSFRRFELIRAQTLGNLYKQSVEIQFQNTDGDLLETQASVWAVTDKKVILKHGLTIPVNAVYKVVT